MRRLVSQLLVCLSLLALTPAVAHAASDKGLTPQEQINTFAYAILNGDAWTVQSLLSRELIHRIETRGRGATYDEKLKSFMEREREKMQRSLDANARAFGYGFTAERMEVHANGDVLGVHLTFAGKPLSKPFYLVREGGELKVSMRKPESSGPTVQGTSYYDVQNMDPVVREFNCQDRAAVQVGAYPAQVTLNCPDLCGFWDGTRMWMHGGRRDCDWNQWGRDGYIQGDFLYCTDYC